MHAHLYCDFVRLFVLFFVLVRYVLVPLIVTIYIYIILYILMLCHDYNSIILVRETLALPTQAALLSTSHMILQIGRSCNAAAIISLHNDTHDKLVYVHFHTLLLTLSP